MQSSVEKDIQEAIKQSSELQKQVQAKLASHADMTPERQNWGHWMVSILPGIDDRLWGRYAMLLYGNVLLLDECVLYTAEYAI